MNIDCPSECCRAGEICRICGDKFYAHIENEKSDCDCCSGKMEWMFEIVIVD
jgi:hypothetical protein